MHRMCTARFVLKKLHASTMNCRGSPTGSELKSDLCPFECCSQFFKVFIVPAERTKRLFELFLFRTRLRSVDLLGKLCNFGQDGNAVVIHLDKPTGHVQLMCNSALEVRKDSRLQLGNQRRVRRQNSQFAVCAWDSNRLNSFGNHAPLWCYNV